MGAIILALAPLILQIGGLLISLFIKNQSDATAAKANLQKWVDSHKNDGLASANQHTNYQDQVDELLATLPTGAKPINPMLLSFGVQGDQVLKLQTALKAKGFDPVDLDGDFGSKTEAAVRLFQSSQKIPVTGVCDDVTWGLLL